MIRSGIVAAGDITNRDTVFSVKAERKLKYHTFIEVFGLNPDMAAKEFSKAKNLLKRAEEYGLTEISVVPHAPYSLSEELFEMVAAWSEKNSGILSMHNQECQDENLLFRELRGSIYDFLKNSGQSLDHRRTGKNSLVSVLPYFSERNNTLLIHNTFTEAGDITDATSRIDNDCLYWVFCPKANLYIEGRLPDIELFRQKRQNIAVGTDSLASNDTLSVLEELKVISTCFPEIPLPEMIKWATLNGAKALKMDDMLGSFKPGKKPGINLIEGADFGKMRLLQGSSVKVVC